MSKTVTVITSLIQNPEKNKFLIVKRTSSSKIHPSLWVFPGGKAEKGEDIIEALKREVKEEINLEIFNLKKISEYEYPRPDGKITFGLCYSSVSSTEDVKLNEELEDFAWITPEEFSNYQHIEELDEEVKKAFNS